MWAGHETQPVTAAIDHLEAARDMLVGSFRLPDYQAALGCARDSVLLCQGQRGLPPELVRELTICLDLLEAVPQAVALRDPGLVRDLRKAAGTHLATAKEMGRDLPAPTHASVE